MSEGQRKARGVQRKLSLIVLIILAIMVFSARGDQTASAVALFVLMAAISVIDAMRHLARDTALNTNREG